MVSEKYEKSAISARNAIINIVFCGILPKKRKMNPFFQNEANNAKFKHFQIHKMCKNIFGTWFWRITFISRSIINLKILKICIFDFIFEKNRYFLFIS